MNPSLRLALLPLLTFCCTSLTAQPPGKSATVVMLSDLHFDPLHDPAKAQQLVATPVEAWDTILFSPDTPNQAADFADLQRACKAKGVDSPAALIKSSLDTAAVQARTQPAAFVTVTGDLIVHGIDCRYAYLIKPNDPAGYADFTAKIARYVLQHIETAFPGVPVYLAGGNNDSSCGDYRMNPSDDSYFGATAPEVLAGLHARVGSRMAAHALSEYRADGSYSILVPGLRNTRLIALDDIFFSSEYKTCSGDPSKAGEDAALAWLNHQLNLAEQAHEHVWVIAHIPPGINAYSTLSKGGNLCDGTAPKLFLEDNRLAETLERHAEVIRLALFGHTHSDEMRLFAGKIPAKLVGSVTPQHGNLPTVTIAQVNRTTARLLDYTVYEASNFTGVDTTWARLYNYHETYKEPDFSAHSIDNLFAAFAVDTSGSDPRSQTYQNFFTPGMLPALALVWKPYVCALTNTTPDAYRSCACTTNPTAK
jgi:sphingomyelin phosphodiesterase acid-like 3